MYGCCVTSRADEPMLCRRWCATQQRARASGTLSASGVKYHRAELDHGINPSINHRSPLNSLSSTRPCLSPRSSVERVTIYTSMHIPIPSRHHRIDAGGRLSQRLRNRTDASPTAYPGASPSEPTIPMLPMLPMLSMLPMLREAPNAPKTRYARLALHIAPRPDLPLTCSSCKPSQGSSQTPPSSSPSCPRRPAQ
jgi:hypothetical protein